MRVYIIRHADPDYPNHTITATGHREAAALAERLAGEGLTHIYSSPAGRALDTMRYTADATGIEPVVHGWLTELVGLHMGTPYRGTSWAFELPGEAARTAPLPGRDDWHQKHPFDEPGFRQVFDDLRSRSDELLAAHGYVREGGLYRVERPSRDRVAVFTHGGLSATWLAHLLEIPLPLSWAGFWLAPSSVTTVLLEERSEHYATPRCLAVGDTSHLCAAGLAPQPRGIPANYD